MIRTTTSAKATASQTRSRATGPCLSFTHARAAKRPNPASILFALFVLNSQAPDRTIVFDIAAFVVLASIVAHGLTDTVGANWIERRVEAHETVGSASPGRRTGDHVA